jgi:tetratricopeptide (TPR) repeat protein
MHPKTKAFILAALALVLLLAPALAQEGLDALQMYRDRRFNDAVAVCLAEINEDPQNMESYVVLTWSLLALERYADAERYALKAYNEIRRDPRITETLGEAAYFQGKNNEALRYFQSYVNLLPDGSRIGTVYYFMGEIYLRQEKYNHADISIRTALQYEPRNARWWARLGYVRERAAEWTYAVAAYDQALASNPDLGDARAGRERALARIQGRN